MYFQQWNAYDHSAVSFLLSGFKIIGPLDLEASSSTKATLVEDINNQGESMANTELSDSICGGEDGTMSMRRATFKEPYLDTILPITEKTFMALPSTRETMTTKQLRDYLKGC